MLDKILEKPESYRKKMAFASTAVLFLTIFFSWVSYKGIWSENPQLAADLKQSNLASVEVSSGNQVNLDNSNSKPSNTVSTPAESAGSAFDILKDQFKLFKSAIGSVFVPFMTGIEVYDSSK
jgi:hypothetical protein